MASHLSFGVKIDSHSCEARVTASGRMMMMQMMGAFAEFERAMVRERTQAGLRSAHVARPFRVHRATISRVASSARR